MNWFERYGIVGMFFIVMTGIWFFCLFPDSYALLSQNSNNEMLIKYIIGFCGLAFLPIGYVIMIFAQVLYYRGYFGKKISCEYWKKLLGSVKRGIKAEEYKNVLQALSEKDQEDEAKMEAILSYYDRKHTCDLEKSKYISAFATKRFDVIAINNGLCLTILISLICAICLILVSLNITLKELSEFPGNIHFSDFAILFAIVTGGILWFSRDILENRLLLRIVISFICSICLILISLNITLKELLKFLGSIHFPVWFAILFAIVVGGILGVSRHILENQIIEIGKRKLRDINI